MCRVDEAEPWAVYDQTNPVARKDHTCCECQRTIRAGERYHYGRGLLDGNWFSFSWCRHCDAAGEWMNRECNGYMVEGLLEELVEHWSEDELFRSPWLARAIAGMRQKWLDGRMPVPGPPPVLAVSA